MEETPQKDDKKIHKNDDQHKKSIDILPKKYIVETPFEINQRKYNMEKKLIEEFVPLLRPIKPFIVPSKLRLNKKSFKDMKKNKQNKILIENKKYFISCPSTDEEEDSEEFNSSEDNIYLSHEKEQNLNKMRKNMENLKKINIPKIKSNHEVTNRKNNDYYGFSSESDLDSIDEYGDYSEIKFNTKNCMREGENECKEVKRTNSFSILEILQKNSRKDN